MTDISKERQCKRMPFGFQRGVFPTAFPISSSPDNRGQRRMPGQNKEHTDASFVTDSTHMAHHTVLFHLRLSKGQSIGPSALRKLWSAASGSDDVSVSRMTDGSDYRSVGNTYSLYGPPGIANLQSIELRLRQIFAEMSSGTISLTSV